jgi:hypothetical protein
MKTTIEQFWSLIEKTRQAFKLEDVWADTNAQESYLLEILRFVQNHPSDRQELIYCFIKLLGPRSGYPHEIVVFCMRELRWPEIREAAAKICDENDDFRTKTIMADILAVYREDWDGGDFYPYYSKQQKI